MNVFQNLVNPYENLYKLQSIAINQDITKQQAEQLVIQFGLLHNAYGLIFKDIVKVLSFKFNQQTQSKSKTDQIKTQIISNSNLRFTDGDVQTKRIQKQSHLGATLSFQEFSYAQKISKEQVIQNKRIDDQKGWKNNRNQINKHKQFNFFSSEDGSSNQSKNDKNNIFKNNNEKTSNISSKQSKKQTFHIKNKKMNEKQIPMDLEKFEIDESSISSSDFNILFPKFSKVKEPQQKSRNYKLIQKIQIIEEQKYEDRAKDKDKDKEDVKNEQITKQLKNQVEKKNVKPDFYNRYKGQCQEPVERIKAGRKKQERQVYPGIPCLNCYRFYEAIGREGQELCNCSSRHRSNKPMLKPQDHKFSQEFNFD